MKRTLILAGMVALVTCISGLGRAADEERDWSSASKQNSVLAYDEYLQAHPAGPHALEARKKAAEQSKLEIAKAAKSCNPDFLLMLYYGVSGSENREIDEAILAGAVGQAAECNFTWTLDYDERTRRTELAIKAREEMEPLTKGRLPVTALIDLDHLLFGLEIAVVEDADKIIFKCQDQSIWSDTSAADFKQCANLHKERKAIMVKAMAIQIEYDLGQVGKVEDKDFRGEFWDRYYKLCRDNIFLDVIFKFRLGPNLTAAKTEEPDPKLKKKIEKVEKKVKSYDPRKR